MCGNWLGSGSLLPAAPALPMLVAGAVGTCVAVAVAPSSWLARAPVGTRREIAFRRPGMGSTCVVVAIGLLLAPTLLFAFPAETITAVVWGIVLAVVASPALVLLTILLGWPTRGGDPVRSLQRSDCSYYRLAVAGGAASLVVALATVLRSQSGLWPLLPSLLAFAMSVALAHRSAQRNAARNALVAELTGPNADVSLRPLVGWNIPPMPNIAAGNATYVAFKIPARADVGPSYRVSAAPVVDAEPVCLLGQPYATGLHTSPRAVAAWCVVGLTLMNVLAFA